MILKPTFGGVNNSLVACGSEDFKIYIWHKEKEDLLSTLEGHNASINAVHWSPTDQYLFVSASDDKTVKLWSVEGVTCTVIAEEKERTKIDLFEVSAKIGIGMQARFSYGELDEDDVDEDEEEDDDDIEF